MTVPAHSPSRLLLARAPLDADTLAAHGNDTVRVDTPTVDLGPPLARRPPPGDVVIDLTGTPPSGRMRPPRRGRRWLVLLGVVAVVAASLAAANYSVALRWRARALSAERRAVQASADAATQRNVAAEARRARDVARQRRRVMAGQLAVSEADVTALEARVFALAGQRAQVEDLGLDAARVSPEALLRSLKAQVDSCIAQVDAAREGLTADADSSRWQAALTAARASCEQVAADLDALASTAR